MNSSDITIKALVVRVKQALELLQISRSSMYAKWDPKSPQYDQTFPPRIRLGANSIGLLRADIEAWLKAQSDAKLQVEGRVS
ncbi:MAG: AlpA family phage regulatory protein [Rhodocyclaceae bacterium]